MCQRKKHAVTPLEEPEKIHWEGTARRDYGEGQIFSFFARARESEKKKKFAGSCGGWAGAGARSVVAVNASVQKEALRYEIN